MLPRSIRRSLGTLLILAPSLLIAVLIYKNGVDFPVLDAWDGTAPLFEKMADGTLGFADFYEQHNEHRIFFPRLISFSLGRLTHWDVRAELWVIWLLTLICLFNMWQIARRSVCCVLQGKVGGEQLLFQSVPAPETQATPPVQSKADRGEFGPFWLLFAASVLLFSPQSVANFLWGFQIGFLLPLACITACIWALYLRHPLNFVLAIVLCTICTFSIGGGFTSWLLTTPLLVWAPTISPASRKWWILWVSLFSLELLLYFWDYQKPAEHPPMWWFLAHPIFAAEYVLLFFGGPFSRGTNLPPMRVGLSMGALLLILFLAAAFYVWRKRSDRSLVRETAPWFVLAMVTVNYAILVMIGRAGLGPGQARAPRYLPFAVMLPIALLALGRVIYSGCARSASTRARRAITGALAACMLPLIFFTGASFFGGLPFWPMNRQLNAYRKSLVTFVDVVPVTDQLREAVFPRPDRVITAANVLNRIGYWRPPLARSNLVSDIASAGDECASGLFQFDLGEPGWINGTGRAFLLNEQRPADAVLVTYDDATARGKPQICAITPVGNPYEVAPLRAVWDSSVLSSTWKCRFTRERLPHGHHYYLEAWAFNADENRAYRLRGEPIFVW